MTDLYDGSDGLYRPSGVTPHEIAVAILERLEKLNTGLHGPLPLMDPRAIAGQIQSQVKALRASVLVDGQHTEARGVELGAWLVGLLLARARVEDGSPFTGHEAA